MDIGDLTPQELRDLAAKKEAAELHRSHIPEADRLEIEAAESDIVEDEDAPTPLKLWERRVEVDGVPYVVDMRRIKDTKGMRLMAELYENKTFSSLARMCDYSFAPIEDQVVAVVIDEMGYDDAERHYEIMGKILEAVQAKN